MTTGPIAHADAAFFALLDKDGDGKVTVDDLKECLRKHNLPSDYAHQFIERARGGRWWGNSINFSEVRALSNLLHAGCVNVLDLAQMNRSRVHGRSGHVRGLYSCAYCSVQEPGGRQRVQDAQSLQSAGNRCQGKS